jgi:5-methylcytosine-specific restriction endonuclease McrA
MQTNYVFLLDQNRVPLNPVSPRKARKLLEKNKAAVLRQFPFTLILKRTVENPVVEPLVLKIDPGSKTSGISLVQGNTVVWGANLEHRGQQIKDSLESRRASRRSRRSRKTRYRRPPLHYWFRKGNKQPVPKKKRQGWLPPSLMHRIQTIETWVNRLIRFCPIKEIWIESVKFDMQLMQNPEISGIEYQQGSLKGYQVREYLLEKWGRKCSYCGKTDVPLQVEHIEPKSKGGSNRVSNLCLACEKCNQKKGNKDVKQFLKNKPDVLKKIKQQQKASLKDAAAVNSTRNKLIEVLSNKLPVHTSDGATTKFNRLSQGIEKDHWKDASCIGSHGSNIEFATEQPLTIRCAGTNNRQYIIPNKYGFARGHRPQQKSVKGFQTGDIVKAIVTSGKKVGKYLGRVAVRTSGSFNIKTKDSTVQGINFKFCKIVQSSDGYIYGF